MKLKKQERKTGGKGIQHKTEAEGTNGTKLSRMGTLIEKWGAYSYESQSQSFVKKVLRTEFLSKAGRKEGLEKK